MLIFRVFCLAAKWLILISCCLQHLRQRLLVATSFLQRWHLCRSLLPMLKQGCIKCFKPLGFPGLVLLLKKNHSYLKRIIFLAYTCFKKPILVKLNLGHLELEIKSKSWQSIKEVAANLKLVLYRLLFLRILVTLPFFCLSWFIKWFYLFYSIPPTIVLITRWYLHSLKFKNMDFLLYLQNVIWPGGWGQIWAKKKLFWYSKPPGICPSFGGTVDETQFH